MKYVLDFIRENKELLQLLCYLIISVISTLIVILCKKKKVTNELDNILKIVLANLPKIVLSAEELIGAGNGSEKKVLVLESVKEFVWKQFSVNLPDSILSYIGERIEDILATPQKKKEIL